MTETAQLERPDMVASPAADDAAGAAAEPKVFVVRNLMAAMMMGRWHGHDDDVAAILQALTCALGDSRPLDVNLALASALRGDLAPTQALLAQDLDRWPAADQTRLTLALALKVGGDAQWAELPKRILAVSTEASVRAYAERVLAA
jgi:hypothetical protein